MIKPNNERGQALIMAVLVMLVLAVLGALFVAIIAMQLRQSERQSSAIALQEIAEAGLRYADHNLVQGPEGADWRPTPTNPMTYDFGDGEFALTVSYRPRSGDPYSRFIKLESVARIVSTNPATGARTVNPFLQRRLVAYKPILITDHARFVTNADKNPLPASLGANLRMYLYENPTLGWPQRRAPGRLYKTVIDGPIRINTDLTWHSDVQVNLASARGDNVAVAGSIYHDVAKRWNATDNQWSGPDSEVLVSRDGGVPQAVAPSDSLAFSTLGGLYRDGLQQADAGGNARWVRYLDPPALDPARYLALTRDSGEWVDGAPGTEYEGRQVNTGWFGYGKGLFINNPEDIKFNHDYDRMRSEWVAATNPYQPAAVLIEFMLADPPGTPYPFLRLTWRGAGAGFRWPRGAARPDTTIPMPFPQNGVIYAAGDVAVRGNLPMRVGSPARYYDQTAYRFDFATGQALQPKPDNSPRGPDANRHYHLTVVSGGNIFIEGGIMSPLSAGRPGANADTDTKLALLARDSVVLNTLGFVATTQVAVSVNVEGASWYEVRPDRPLDVFLPPVGSLAPIKLYYDQTGQPNMALPLGHDGAALMQLLINGLPYDWNRGALGVYGDRYKYYLFAPTPIEKYNNETNAIYPIEESIPNTAFGADKRVVFSPVLVGEQPTIRFQVTHDSPRFYWVRNIQASVDTEIDAIVYAEHGSWFIIPGDWRTAPEPETGDPAWDPGNLPQPLPGEPLDARLLVRGAVSENRTAPIADVIDWSSKWRGANRSWLPANPDYDPNLGISRFTLRYEYDTSVRRGLFPSDPGSPPCLPKLPVSPAMIAWGERI